jgi:hypothetical protein
MDLNVFEKLVVQFFVHEIGMNPHLYSVQMLFVPVLNPKPYIDQQVERIRKRLAAVIIRNFLQKQSRDGKILLFKIINHHLEQYMKEYRMKVLHDHYKSWYVICKLEEMRSSNKINAIYSDD